MTVVVPADQFPVLHSAILSLSAERREVFLEHLIGGTSADYLSDWMRRAGSPVGATTIKRFRRWNGTDK